jgi:rubrerythrin
MAALLGEKKDRSASFESARKGLRLTGASVQTRQLVELVARHGSEEGRLLATYEDLAGRTTHEGVRYLVDLILEDERRHHRMLAEIANSMAWGATSGSPEGSTPAFPLAVGAELLEQTKVLRRSERSDYRELRRIRRRLRPFAGTTLWSLVVDLMMLDTKKHEAILRFIEQHGRAT